jgi:hypothetical protein
MLSSSRSFRIKLTIKALKPPKTDAAAADPDPLPLLLLLLILCRCCGLCRRRSCSALRKYEAAGQGIAFEVRRLRF